MTSLTEISFTDFTGKLITLARERRRHNGVDVELVKVRIGQRPQIPSFHFTPEQAREAGMFLIGEPK